MASVTDNRTEIIGRRAGRGIGEHGAAAFLGLVCIFILFANLGGAGLFEPDEGRNSEKAREILLLNDWVTPHHNFLPTLDKPMAFYWPVALSFRLFGLSEWAARLPSALAALGCLLLIYQFARRQWGLREALWSCLVLVTNVGFFIFARVVIFDMSLSFFLALALFYFYSAVRAEEARRRLMCHVVMYAALGAGTLIKGAVAVVLPSLVIGSYILLTRRWYLVPRMGIARGAIIYLAVVAPWYLWSEVRNPGYLNYFLWEEHFVRYTSADFERSKGWYYFIVVTAAGFFPWIAVLPQAARHMWRERGNDTTRFLALWALVPVIFFSFSMSQLPQYILPMVPALALLAGRYLAERISGAGTQAWKRILLPWGCVISVMIYLLLGALWPNLLVRHVRPAVAQNVAPLAASGAALLLILGIFFNGYRKKFWRGWEPVYCSTATGFALFFIVLAQMTTAVSQDRSAKSVAQTTAAFIAPEDRVVFYDTYLTGIPFYLSLDRPSWIVQDEEKEKILGSSYLAARRPPAAAGHGQVIFSFSDFAQQWNRKDLVLRVIVKEKNFRRLSSNVGAVPKILTKVDEYLLVTNR